jgi:hypothetical protein
MKTPCLQPPRSETLCFHWLFVDMFDVGRQKHHVFMGLFLWCLIFLAQHPHRTDPCSPTWIVCWSGKIKTYQTNNTAQWKHGVLDKRHQQCQTIKWTHTVFGSSNTLCFHWVVLHVWCRLTNTLYCHRLDVFLTFLFSPAQQTHRTDHCSPTWIACWTGKSQMWNNLWQHPVFDNRHQQRQQQIQWTQCFWLVHLTKIMCSWVVFSGLMSVDKNTVFSLSVCFDMFDFYSSLNTPKRPL